MDNDACNTRSHHIYSSPDLKAWKKESEFGKEVGAHGGVWECPDLFPINYNGEKVWILVVNLNPGGPNVGSATQYFTGQFDGSRFTPFQTDTRWLDYGPDEYAGITWSNTGDRKIFRMDEQLAVCRQGAYRKMEKCHDHPTRAGFTKDG